MGILKLGCKDTDASFLKKGNTFFCTACNAWNGKNGSNGRTDEVWVVNVGERVAYNHGIGTGSIGTAKDGA